jgi:sulfate transport system ATP-binding protein
LSPSPFSNGASDTLSLDARRTEPTGPVDVRVSGIVKEYGTAPALRNVDLHVRAGELIALLGPSGSGKTTLLRVIAGLEIPDAGQVLFGGEDTTDVPVQKRGVGFVFQHYALFKHLRVFDNIAYGLRVRSRTTRPSADEISERVLKLLDLVQLKGLERRFPAQLSGGQRQRVALARALAVEPRVLLLDEPFGALDAQVRKDLRRWLREIHDETGQTTIFVTHDQDEALELADRVAILSQGRIEQVGTPDEVHDSPASAFVMSFVGESARVPVVVRDGAVFFAERRLPVPPREGQDGPAFLYLRPSDVAICAEQEDGIPGRVSVVRRAAAGRLAEVQIEGTEALVEVDVPPDARIARGDALRLSVKGGRIFQA